MEDSASCRESEREKGHDWYQYGQKSYRWTSPVRNKRVGALRTATAVLLAFTMISVGCSGADDFIVRGWLPFYYPYGFP